MFSVTGLPVKIGKSLCIKLLSDIFQFSINKNWFVLFVSVSQLTVSQFVDNVGGVSEVA